MSESCAASEYCTTKTQILCCLCKTVCCPKHRTPCCVGSKPTGQRYKSYICTICNPKE